MPVPCRPVFSPQAPHWDAHRRTHQAAHELCGHRASQPPRSAALRGGATASNWTYRRRWNARRGPQQPDSNTASAKMYGRWSSIYHPQRYFSFLSRPSAARAKKFTSYSGSRSFVNLCSSSFLGPCNFSRRGLPCAASTCLME